MGELTVSEILNKLNEKIIPSVKWKNDPSGLMVGNPQKTVRKIMTALNPSPEVVKEAVQTSCDLIVSHHPLFKKPVGSLVEGEYYSDIIMPLIKSDISLISCHTNFDLYKYGVSYLLAKELDLVNITPLVPVGNIDSVELNELYKMVVYVPVEFSENIKKAIDENGGAKTGAYDHCYFDLEGNGTFRPGKGTDPFIGSEGEIENVKEIRIETIVTSWNRDNIFEAVRSIHPYEEPVIDIYPLDNSSGNFGLGATGELKNPVTFSEFVKIVSETLSTNTLRTAVHDDNRVIKKAAVCGGSGSSFWKNAFKTGADVFVTSEFNHHLYQEASYYMNIIDATHHSTEQFAMKGLKEYLEDRLPERVKIIRSEKDSDPVKDIQNGV